MCFSCTEPKTIHTVGPQAPNPALSKNNILIQE